VAEGWVSVGSRKLRAPADGPAVLVRARLDDRLEEVGRRRLTLVTAAPGLGKTSLLAGWARRQGCAWYSVGADDSDPAVLARGLLEAVRLRVPAVDPAAVAAPTTSEGWAIPSEGQGSLAADQVVGMLTERLLDDLTLVIDDVHELAGADSSYRLLGDLVRGGPSLLHIVLSSRTDPVFGVARLRGQGLASDLPGSALRFTGAETAAMAATILGDDRDGLAAELHEATAGWPAGVRVIAEWLREAPADRWPAMVRRAGDAGGPLEALLVEEVLPATPVAVVELLRAVVPLDRFTAPLAAELVGPGADELVTTLARDGLWVVPDTDRHGWLVVPPVLRGFARSRLAVGATDSAVMLRRAAAWLEGQGETGRALAGLLAGGLSPGGNAGGDDGAPVGTEPAGEPADRSDDTDACVEGGARLVRGDYDGAVAAVGPCLTQSGSVGLSAGLVAGLAHHFRGELEEALAIYDRALESDGSPALRAMVLGWAAGASWLVGDVDRCRRLTGEVEDAARLSGDDRAWAMAHTARGMAAAFEGDRQAMRHYERALAHAEAAHDHLQIVRIRNNRGSRFLSEGYYREALVELDEAVRLSVLAGIGMFRGLTLATRGEVLLGLGRLDEAARELEAAKADYEQRGSRMASYPLAHLGTVHRLQGHLTLARAHYEEALSIAETSGDHQGRVPALAGLALCLADTDPEEATRLTARALALASLTRPEALIAAAEAALRTGDLVVAAARAEEASRAARSHRDRPALAEALELQARVLGDPRSAAPLLEEAASVWAAIGNPLGEARVLLAQARLGGAGALTAAVEAERALSQLGARTLASEAARLQADLASAALPALAVRVLGGFGVERSGVPVHTVEWQSRKARDLLKVLIARRGHPVPRDVLIDLLWEDEDPARAGSRLSVTLSTLRAVLDPEKRFDPEHFLAHDRTAAWARLDHMTVDVEVFLDNARAGLWALAAGDPGAAALLAKAEASYAGEFLEEDVYTDWSTVLREEARTTYVSVAMALADLTLAAADHDGAARYLLRVLARDQYDERAHLQLVAALTGAGRHGEARRMYRSYCDRMAAIDVEPVAFPDARPRTPSRTEA